MKSSKRTYRQHQRLWQDTLAQINGVVGTGETPEHYFRHVTETLTDFEFLAKSRRGINFSSTGKINLKEFYLSTALEIIGVCEEWCEKATTYMKTHHPWKNRTGNAERGLNASIAGMEDQNIVMYLYHSVPYGKFLEGENGFRYPHAGWLHIIEPTIEEFSPQLIKSLQGIFAR